MSLESVRKAAPSATPRQGRCACPERGGCRLVAGVRGVPGVPPPLRAHPAHPAPGRPAASARKKPRQRPHTPHTRTRGTRAGARVSREGTPTLQVTAQRHPQLPGPRRIEAESITSLWYPESLLMNWVVLRHSMTPTCGPLPLWSRLDAETPAHRHDAYPRPLPPAASRV